MASGILSIAVDDLSIGSEKVSKGSKKLSVGMEKVSGAVDVLSETTVAARELNSCKNLSRRLRANERESRNGAKTQLHPPWDDSGR